MERSDFRVRDPYILVADGVYYFYQSKVTEVPDTVVVRQSTDLVQWSEPTVVYTLDRSTWKMRELWAPEVHAYEGKYYLFLSVLGKNGLRGTEISVSTSPKGPFLPVADRPATPLDQSCIDGTLIMEDGVPYIVYSRDWPHCFDSALRAYVGEIRAQALSKDLSTPVGEAFCLFRSVDCPLSAAAPARHAWEGKPVVRYGSDAPFLMRLADGRLFLTWSPIPANNYVVLGATAECLRGTWTHFDEPIYDRNGGHAMFFCATDGRMKMAIHGPESAGLERLLLFDVAWNGAQPILTPLQ